MSSFANSGDMPYLFGFVAVIAVLTAAITVVTRRLRPNAGKAAIAISAGLALPFVVFALGFALFMLMPAGDSPDGPGMLFAGVIGLTIVSLPISLLTSAVVVSMRGR